MSVFLAPSADLASSITAEVTVEAEYGATVVLGSLYTAAHHQPEMAGNPAPCNDREIPLVGDGTILVSHVDLDTFGGCLRALGGFEDIFEHESFWSLAEFVDLNGAHKLAQSGASEQDLLRLHAFWAWSRENIPRFPRDECSDVTEHVQNAGLALRSLLNGDKDLLDAGQAFWDAGDALNRRTFRSKEGPIIVRIAEDQSDFCNHLYATPDGEPGKAVACLNHATGAITISLESPVPGVSCRVIVQDLWGPKAGGHDGIAGSPRGRLMLMDDLENAVQRLRDSL